MEYDKAVKMCDWNYVHITMNKSSKHNVTKIIYSNKYRIL